MKKILLLNLFAAFFICPAIAQSKSSDTTQTFSNPLKVQFGDPYVLLTNGTYYMYGTGGADKGFAAYSSKDLVNWKPEGQV